MKTILVTEKPHGKYRLLANWVFDGIPFHQWFTCEKDLREYFEGWIGWKIKRI